jgi:N-acetyl-alpha-D-muramate 1-phosphate uridylyltransferase
MTWTPDSAFVLAAGLGTRMRPLTDRLPKPLVSVAGRALIDHVLDRIATAGVQRAMVNVHYLADLIEAHVAARTSPAIAISDERRLLLDTGGGVVKAMPLIGDAPFLVHNSDSIWHERGVSNLRQLFRSFDPARMDSLLLLARREECLGYDGRGDFELAPDGRVTRVAKGATADHVFTGVSIATRKLMRNAPAGPFSLNVVWDRAIAEGRLYGLVLDGVWMHVGDPQAVRDAERFFADVQAT